MTLAASRVLTRLQRAGRSGESGSQLALVLDMPAPSVRRCVQELIRDGHNITFVTGRNACYTLFTEEQTYG